MYRSSDIDKAVYKAGEVAKIAGVTVETIRNYGNKGIITFIRSPGGHRFVERTELIRFLKQRGLFEENGPDNKQDIIYTRTDTQERADAGELDRQAMHILEHQTGLQNPLVIKDIGLCTDEKREEIQKLIGMVMNNKVHNIYITQHDILTRYGYYYLDSTFKAHGTNIIIVGGLY